MLVITYRFHVVPRYQDHFRHAYQAARETLVQSIGLVSHEFKDPRDRGEAFTLLLAWNGRASFERFTRTWAGVWMLNGMGLAHDAFAAPIETAMDGEKSSLRAGKRAT